VRTKNVRNNLLYGGDDRKQLKQQFKELETVKENSHMEATE
jgi:hypothetical protein